MKAKAREGTSVLKQTFKEFMEDDCMRMAAALSYYTVFSLPPLLVLIITVAGAFLTPQDIQGNVEQEIEALMGPDAAAQVQTMIQSASESVARSGTLGTVLGIVALLFGATGAFAQLQQALNEAWEVAPDPEQSSILSFALKRIFSLGMILGIAFLLLVSLLLSAVISALGETAGTYLPGGLTEGFLQVVNVAVSLGVVTLLFAAIYKILPDVEVAWRDVWTGAFATALLFTLGKLLIGLYLGHSNPGSAFGAAGSLALILVWIYYSSMILLLGAEFTQVWARRYGGRIRPSRGAVRVVQERRHLREGEEAPPHGGESSA